MTDTTIIGFKPSIENPLATDTLWDAAGDLVVGTGANTAAILAKGTTGYFLKAGDTTLEWASGTSGSGEVATDNIWTATGDIAVGTGTHTAAVITKGIEGQFLKTGASTLEWATVATPPTTGEIFLSCAGGWDSATSPAGGFVTTETSTYKVNIRGTSFPASASDIYHEWSHQLPADYNGGTVTAIPTIFVPTSTDASDHTIILGLSAVSYADGDTADTDFGTAQTSTETVSSSIAGKIIKMAATSAITIGNTPAAGDWVQWRMRREGDDTYTGDIVVLGWMITYTRS
jgi:hypothetical protein